MSGKSKVAKGGQIVSLSQRGNMDEEARKAERNRAAFEAWLEKKRDERQKEQAVKIQAARREEEEWERRRGVGQRAFQRWLKMKRAEDILMKKEVARDIEMERLKREEQRERFHRSEAAFNTWKHVKDTELDTERKLEKQYHLNPTTISREPTPSLPGYCSVWSCDQDMAQHFVTRVRRSRSLELTRHGSNSFFPNPSPHLTTS